MLLRPGEYSARGGNSSTITSPKLIRDRDDGGVPCARVDGLPG
jgi:hypothetical protein